MLRLSLSHCTSDGEAGLLFRGKPAYSVCDRRGERMKRGNTKYHVLWQGSNSSDGTSKLDGTSKQALNVNQRAMDAWLNQKQKHRKSHFQLVCLLLSQD